MVPIVRDSRKNIFERFVEQQAEKALLDTPADLIVGPRRAGKTTLVRKIGEASRTYITLNDQTSIFLAPECCNPLHLEAKDQFRKKHPRSGEAKRWRD